MVSRPCICSCVQVDIVMKGSCWWADCEIVQMKTVSVALVLCLNVGVDPPDVVKINPCARLECWVGKFTTCLLIWVHIALRNTTVNRYGIYIVLFAFTHSLVASSQCYIFNVMKFAVVAFLVIMNGWVQHKLVSIVYFLVLEILALVLVLIVLRWFVTSKGCPCWHDAPKWLSDNQYGTQTAWCWNAYT